MAYQFIRSAAQYLNASSVLITEPITLACWFFSTDNALAQALVTINNTSTGDRVQLLASGNVAGDPVQANTTIGATTASAASTTLGYSLNTWHHACAVFTSKGLRTAYIDASNSGTDTFTRNTNYGSVAQVGISARHNGTSWGLGTNGNIAEVGIWNAALTAEEIASLAKGMTCDKIRPQNLVFYAPLIRDLQDTKGGLTITNNNTATVANHPRIYS
jgi:hypothetical protein